ncbi:MAG TPA: hypothetical protein VL995_13755 [Cellvibrio sp.]|nr:hypothetical protein [Cellvibrio sp.]
MQPIHTAWLVFLIPLLVVNASWVWSSVAGAIEWCLPYWSGCVSISKAARSSDALFLFRAAMILNAALLMHFWLHSWQFLLLHQRRVQSVPVLGITAALFLILYANFLGTQGKVYQLLRQYGVTIYFAFTVLAQMIFTRHLLQLGLLKIQRLVRWEFYLCGWLLALGIISIFCNTLLTGEPKDRWENIIEWHFALGMNLYFLLTALIWKQLGFYHTPAQQHRH